MYEMRYSNAAQRYFKKIKEKGLKTAFRKALETISENPYCGTLKAGDLAGIYGYDVFYNVSAKYSCGFSIFLVSSIIVDEKYLDYFNTITEDRL